MQQLVSMTVLGSKDRSNTTSYNTATMSEEEDFVMGQNGVQTKKEEEEEEEEEAAMDLMKRNFASMAAAAAAAAAAATMAATNR